MRPESKFVNEIHNSFSHLFREKAFFIKIPDMPFGKEQREQLPEYIKYNPVKPFDIITVVNGKPFAIEAKSCQKSNNFTFTSVTVRQTGNLWLFNKAGGIAFVAIKASELYSLFIPIEKFIILKNTFKDTGKLLMSPQSSFAIIQRETYGKKIWDIEELITGSTIQSKLAIYTN